MIADSVCRFVKQLVFHGVPAAGVLAIELLKRDELRSFPSSHYQYNEMPPLSRSETLQQLSVLASAMEAFGPNEGNHGLCVLGLNAIRKFLDRML